MRFTRALFQVSAFKSVFRRSFSQNAPVVKVLDEKCNDHLILTFRYKNSSKIRFEASKVEHVQTVLSRIKLMVALHRKRDELRRAVVNKYSNTAQVAVENSDEYVDVCLIQNDEVLSENVPNVDAWSQASMLKVGNEFYEVMYNTPTVLKLSLPDYIVAGCAFRPHFILECASRNESVFTWYRSISADKAHDFKSCDVLTEGDKLWLKVSEGFVYFTTYQDIGCHLKLICTPKQNGKSGPSYATVSKSVVEAGPEIFPFEERHAYTKHLCDHNCIRCVSYNTLANVYVEQRKFPYCSSKARDVYYRKQLLMKELIGYNSDVICLQEVQERVFEHDLIPILREAGLDGLYIRKGGRRYEGVATFFRTSKYKVLRNYSTLLNESINRKSIFGDLLNKVPRNKIMSKLLAQDTAFQIVLLEDCEIPTRKVLVANIHLYSNKDSPEVRFLQAALCLYYIEHIIKIENLENFGILLCGDFNSLPGSEVFQFITSGNFECSSMWGSSINSPNEDNLLQHNLHLDSACGIPEYTNYTEEFQGCLDYIFYSQNSFEVTEIVPMPSHDAVIAQVGLPNEFFPSDHLALVCTLQWKDKNA